MPQLLELVQLALLLLIGFFSSYLILLLQYCDKYGDHIGFPHLEEWRKELCLSALRNADINLETYRDSYDDLELLQEAHKSPHFTQLEPKSLPFSDPIN